MIIFQQKPEWAKGGYHYYVGKIEKRLLKSPNDPVLLQKGCEALTQYTFGFIMEEADRLMTIDYNGGKELYSQANEHFNQAVQYGNKSLMLKFEKYDGWISNQSDLTPKFTDEDVPTLFWTAAAYGGQLLETALTIDSNWNKGAIYSAMISYTMSRPDPPNKKESIAEDFFKKAVIASNGLDLGPYVTLAESVMIPTQNRNEFTNLLYKALNIDMKADPDLALANQINRNRAQWLMDNIDEFFY